MIKLGHAASACGILISPVAKRMKKISYRGIDSHLRSYTKI